MDIQRQLFVPFRKPPRIERHDVHLAAKVIVVKGLQRLLPIGQSGAAQPRENVGRSVPRRRGGNGNRTTEHSTEWPHRYRERDAGR